LQINRSHIIAKGISHKGRVRRENEDSIFIDEDGNFMLLADGMGGHEYGGEASRTALEVIKENFSKELIVSSFLNTSESNSTASDIDHLFSVVITSAMSDAVKKANTVLFNRSMKEGLQQFMGTTLVGLVTLPESGHVLWAHVGDSRIYQWRDSELKRLTVDHSAYTKWLMNGKKGKKPGKNLITRAIGTREYVTTDIGWGEQKKDDIYILCSDGLNGMITDKKIASILEAGTDVDNIAKNLIDAANDAGGKDNVSVVVCKVPP
jgi:serine/threonine protein phosphatase PrpC